MARSIAAVIAGYITMFIGVSTVLTFIFIVFLGGLPEEPGPFTGPTWVLYAEVVSSVIVAIGGGYVCAWVAKRAEMKHAAAMIGLMLILGIASIIGEAGLKPLWSSIGVVVLSPIGVLFGAHLRRRQAAEARLG